MKNILLLLCFFLHFGHLLVGQQNCALDTISSCFVEERFNLGRIDIEIKEQINDSFRSSVNFSLVDIDGDCQGEVFGGSKFSKLNIVDIGNPENENEIETFIRRWTDNTTQNLVIGNINGKIHIFLAVLWGSERLDLNGRVVCFNLDGSIEWISDELYHNPRWIPRNYEHFPTLGLADFNQDGIPEVYTGNRIFSAVSGKLLCTGEWYGGVGTNFRVSNTVAADLDNNPNDLELAAGYTIYDVVLNNTVDSSGNEMIPYNMQIDGDFYDGRTSVVDVDGDGQLDVVVNFGRNNRRNPFLYSYTLKGTTTEIIAKVDWPVQIKTWEVGVSTPSAGYIRNRSQQDIIILTADTLRCYEYDGTNTFNVVWSLPISDEPNGGTTPILFDFNGDGIQEIIHNGQEEIAIIDGSLPVPSIVARYPCITLTHFDNPIVGNVIGDEAAEICAYCAITDTTPVYGSLTIFGSPDSLGPWAPAPPTWNQYSYHPLSINDDLTVPQFQKNKATYEGGRYNTFMSQRTLLDSNGMYKRRAASIYGEIDCINYNIETDEYTIAFSVFNRSDASLTADSAMEVVFYDGDPQGGGVIIGSYITNSEILAGNGLTGLTFTYSANNLSTLFMVVNTSGADFTTIDKDDFGILECDFFDNFSQSRDLPEILDLTDSICDGQDYAFLDTIVNQEGIYLRTLKDSSGCDSIVARLVLEISDSIHIIERIETCDEYTWKGTTYTESGTHSETYNVPDGCDSTVTLDLTINNSTLDTTKTTVCDSLVWNGEVLRSSGFYTFQGRTTEGCDSTFVLDLTVRSSTTATIQTTTCQSYTWKGNTYDQSGTYRFDTLNSQGCDSILFLDLRIRDTIRTDASVNICTGDTILVFNQEVFSSQVLTQDFKTPEGCDSTHTVDVVVDDVYRGMRQVSFCEGDSIYIIDRWINEEGRVEITKINAQDCDSIIAVHAEVLPTQRSYDTIQLCNGDTLLWENEVITRTSEVSTTTIGQNGCDSTSHLRAEFEQTWMSEMDFELCPGDSILINGQWVKSNQEVIQEYVAQNGCDSVIVVNIHQVATPDTPTYVLNCETRRVEVSIIAADIWSISWDNGAQTATTNYPTGTTAEVTLTAAPNCIITYQVTLPDVPVLPSIPKLRDTLLTRGGLLNLDLALDPSILKVTWSPSEMIDCDTCMQVRITSTQDVEIKVEYTHNSGCVIEDAFWIRYEEAGIFIPNVFSPNGDNINDRWQIYHTDNIDVERILIFDRWGELIYDSNETGLTTWDGVFNGELVRPGVYTYMVSYSDGAESQILGGDVTVVY